jgi:serine/threonine protein kinase
VKVLPTSLSRDAERLKRFEQEAQAASALNHTNILTIFDIGTHEGAPYLVMELLEGETLRERLTNTAGRASLGPLSTRELPCQREKLRIMECRSRTGWPQRTKRASCIAT